MFYHFEHSGNLLFCVATILTIFLFKFIELTLLVLYIRKRWMSINDKLGNCQIKVADHFIAESISGIQVQQSVRLTEIARSFRGKNLYTWWSSVDLRSNR